MKSYRKMKFTLLFLLVFSLCLHAEDWLMFTKEPIHSSFNRTEAQLDRSNVKALQPAWALSVHAGMAAAPTVVNGALYFGDWHGNFYAVDGSDGRVLWQNFVGKAPSPDDPVCQPGIGVTAQATVVGDAVYVGGGDSAVYALDKATGALLWRTQLADAKSGSYIWSSLMVYKGALYLGVASLGDCPLVRGALVKIDLAQPEKPVIKYLAPPNDIGGGIWSTPAIDAETNTIYVTTGTGDQDPEHGLWGGTFAAFDATTLAMKAYYFLPSNSTDEDIEWGSSPTLFRLPDGTRMIAATGKDGVLYALKREDLTPIWQTKIAIECICPECGCGSLSTPAFDGKTLFVGAGASDPNGKNDGTVYAVNPQTGMILWSQQTAGVVIAPVAVANGVMFVASTRGLLTLDAATGEPLWNDQQYSILYSQPVVANGKVYCTYLNGDVVAWSLPVARHSSTQPQSGAAYPLAIQHSAIDAAQIPYVFSWIGGEQQQVSPLAGLDRAQLIELAQRQRAVARSRYNHGRARSSGAKSAGEARAASQ